MALKASSKQVAKGWGWDNLKTLFTVLLGKADTRTHLPLNSKYPDTTFQVLLPAHQAQRHLWW